MVDKIMGKDYSFQVLIKGSTDLKTGIAYYDYIKVGNTIYVYNKSDITRSDMRWAGHLKIINTTECREDAVGKKNGMCFCSEHIKLKT